MQESSSILHTLRNQIVPSLKNHVTRMYDLSSNIPVSDIIYVMFKWHYIIARIVFMDFIIRSVLKVKQIVLL
jgi:hypothetical protein